jgi:hypothetical protein
LIPIKSQLEEEVSHEPALNAYETEEGFDTALFLFEGEDAQCPISSTHHNISLTTPIIDYSPIKNLSVFSKSNQLKSRQAEIVIGIEQLE